MDFKDILKNFRKENKITQKELAVRLDVTHIYISNLEKGKYEPGRAFVEKLAYEMKTPYTLLLLATLTEDNFSMEKKATFKVLKPALESLIKQLL